MLLLDKSTLCKPLIKRELQFYLDMPRDLRPFTPQHKGVIRVHSYSDDDSILSYHPHKHEGAYAELICTRDKLVPHDRTVGVLQSTS